MGTRTTEKNNQFPGIKIAVRKWLAGFFDNPSVLDAYGGYGLMYRVLWKDISDHYGACDGDAVEWLSNNSLDYDIFDVDPYSSPYEAIKTIAEKTNKDRFGVVCTDGFLKRQAQMRGKLTSFVCGVTGWPQHDNDLFARIYYQYPKYLRFLLDCLVKDHTLQHLAIKYGLKQSSSTVYFAGVFERK